MSSEINSNYELERRKRILEEHKEQERESFTDTFFSKSIETVADLTGISSAITNIIKKVVTKDNDHNS